DDAPRARRLRPEPEPRALAHHRGGRPPAVGVKTTSKEDGPPMTRPLRLSRALLVILKTLDRHIRGVERLPWVFDFFVTIGLIMFVTGFYFSSEQIGRYFDYDVDLGFVSIATLAFAYVLYSFIQWLSGSAVGSY